MWWTESLGAATNRRRLLLILDRYFDSVIKENRSTKDWFTKTALRVFEMRSSKKFPRCSRIKPRLSFVMVWPRTSVFHLWLWPHPLNRVCEYVWLLFKGGYYLNKYGILHKDKSRWSSNTGPTIVAKKINPTEVDVHYYWWRDARLFLSKISTQKFEGFMPCLWYYKWTTCGHNKKSIWESTYTKCAVLTYHFH